jgi:hypothetical protein
MPLQARKNGKSILYLTHDVLLFELVLLLWHTNELVGSLVVIIKIKMKIKILILKKILHLFGKRLLNGQVLVLVVS